jgi:hypothetical protein
MSMLGISVKVIGVQSNGSIRELTREVLEKDLYQWILRGGEVYVVKRDRLVRYEVSDLDWLVPLGVTVGYSSIAMVDGEGTFWRLDPRRGNEHARSALVQEATVQRPQERGSSGPVFTAKFDPGPVSRSFLPMRTV